MAGTVKVGGEITVNTELQGDQSSPSITALANDRFIVTWNDTSGTLGDSDFLSVKAQIFDSSATKIGGEFRVNTTTAGGQLYPSVTALVGGGFVATYVDSPTSGFDDNRVRAQVFGPDGEKLGPEFFASAPSDRYQSEPNVAALSTGGFVIAWSVDSTAGFVVTSEIRAQMFDAAGAKIGTELPVNSFSLRQQDNPAVTALADGRFVVIWDGPDETGLLNIKVRVFEADGEPAGSEFLVEAPSEGYTARPAVTTLSNGDFVVTWIRTTEVDGPGSDWTIRGQVFTADGAPSGAPFTVIPDADADLISNSPAITALPGGRFAVAWDFGSKPPEGAPITATEPKDVKVQVFGPTGEKLGDAVVANTETTDNQVFASIAALSNHKFVVVWQDNSGVVLDGTASNVKLQAFSFNTVPDIAAPADPLVVDENQTAVTTIAATDAEGDALTFSLSGGADAALFAIDPQSGALSFLAAPDFENPGDVGADNVYDVVVSVSDGLDSVTRDLAIVVGGVNDAPEGQPDGVYHVTEEGTLTVPAASGLLVNDVDPDGQPLTAVQESFAVHGTLDLNPDGSFTYTPDVDFAGTETFYYRASDGITTSAPILVTIAVANVNDVPVAADGAYSTPEDIAITGRRLPSASDADGDSVTYALDTNAAHGTVMVFTSGVFLYFPQANYYGLDSFLFSISDGNGGGAIYTTTITVTARADAPVAAPDAYLATQGQLLAIAAPQGVLANDQDADGDPITAEVLSTTMHGTLALAADGSFTYLANPGYSGSDSFTYRARDGALASFETTVLLQIEPAPVNEITGSESGETLPGTAGPDRIDARGGDDILRGFGGDDILLGGTGDDRLDGGAGEDAMAGGADDDTYIVDDAGDTIDESDGSGGDAGGTDRVISSVDHTLGEFVENLTFTGAGDHVGVGNGLANRIIGHDGADELSGEGGDDLLLGGAGGDTLRGGEGHDRLYGQGGNDILIGGAGDDTYYVDDAGDQVDESDGAGGDAGGTDRVISSVDHTLAAFVENLTFTGADGRIGTGNGIANRIIGTDGTDTLSGHGGNDLLLGGLGHDGLDGGDGEDRLFGQDGDDTLVGGIGEDTLDGGAGMDRLIGGLARDVLTGGAGADSFVFAALPDTRDLIKDFEHGLDRIEIAAAAFGGGLVAGGGVNLIVDGPLAPGVAAFVYSSASGALTWDADGKGGAAAVGVALLANKPILSTADFLLV